MYRKYALWLWLWAATAAGAVELRAQVVTQAPTVLLHDLFVDAHRLPAAWHQQVFVTSPRASTQIKVSRARVQAFLQTLAEASPGAQVTVTGADRVSIRSEFPRLDLQPYQQQAQQALVQRIEQDLAKAQPLRAVQLAIEPLDTAPDLQLPQGDYSMQIQAILPQAIRSTMTVVAVIQVNGQAYQTLHWPFAVTLLADTWQLTRSIEAGQPLAFAVEQRQAVVTDVLPELLQHSSLDGLRAVQSMAAGRTVLRKHAQAIPWVEKESVVEAIVQVNRVTLSIALIAYQEGHQGDRIALYRHHDQQSLLFGQVIAQGQVKLDSL